VIAAAPGAEVVDLPDVGHGSMADDPALVARTIRAFIAAQNTGASA
jgi:pimeloyl-ACP methyl ester carboxylesterase